MAEDLVDNQLLMKTLLKTHGIDIKIAQDGREAVHSALASDFDLVLMDLQMPIMDGYEAARELRRQGYSKPIIALTAHAMKEERDRSRDAGCTGHLTKPITEASLVAALEQYLNV